MSSQAGPPQQTSPALRRASWPGAQMRVSDAERMAIADRLARHFVDGRLDEAEFDDRLDRAMRATTMADLTGLLSDLPEDEPAEPRLPVRRRQQREMLTAERRQRTAARRRRPRSFRLIVVLVAAVIGVIILAHALTHSIGIWLLLGLIAFLWMRRDSSRYRGS